MKSEKEIREEIKATKRTLENHKNAYNMGKISRQALACQKIDCESTIDTLRWVLGEKDRYD